MVYMRLRYSLVLAALAALATIASMIGQMEAISAQNQTIISSGLTQFASPTTLVLRGRMLDTLGQDIDMAKQNGYKIDTVTVFVEQEPGAGLNRIDLIPVYTVFMSKG